MRLVEGFLRGGADWNSIVKHENGQASLRLGVINGCGAIIDCIRLSKSCAAACEKGENRNHNAHRSALNLLIIDNCTMPGRALGAKQLCRESSTAPIVDY